MWLVLTAVPQADAQPRAQPQAVAQPPATLSGEEIRARLEAADADTTLADDARARLKQLYGEAAAALKRAAAAREQGAALKQSADAASVRKQAAESAAARPIDLALPPADPRAPVEQIEAVRQEARALLTAATEQLDEITARITERRKELKTLPQSIAELETAVAKLAEPPGKEEGLEPAVAEARLAAYHAARTAAQVDLDLAKQKLRTFELETDILPLEREQLERRKAAATEAVEALSRLATRRKQDVIQNRFDDFQRAVSAASETRQRQAAATLGIYERWSTFAPETRGRVGELVETRAQVAALQAKYDEIGALVAGDIANGGGLSRSVGYLLARTRLGLAPDQELAVRAATQARLVDEVQETLARIDARLADLPRPPVRAEGREPEASIDTLERELLEAVRKDVEAFLTETLIPLGVQQATLRARVAALRRLVDKHLLWVRSDTFIGSGDLRRAVAGATRLLQPATVLDLLQSLTRAALSRPAAAVAGLAGVVTLLLLHRWFVKQIVRLGGAVTGRGALRLSPTLEALGYTALAAFPGWLALWIPSRLLAGYAGSSILAAAVGQALATVAAMVLPLAFLRQFVRPHGVAAAHFGWPDTVVTSLRRAARRALVLALPLVFIWRLVDIESDVYEELGPLARVFFILLMAATAVVLGPLASARSGAVAALATRHGKEWAARLAWVWQPLAVAVPATLAALKAFGYGYSATALAASVVRSIALMLAALAAHGLAMRWLLISRRRIMLAELRARATARAAAREPTEPPTPGLEVVDAHSLDVSAISQQTRRLIDAAFFVAVLVGLWWIWSPVLPALGFLERITLWQQRAADGTVTGVITLANLLVAVPIVALTFIAVRNLPGLLEAALLRHLPLDTAARYAITSLSSYVLAGVGLTLAAGTLGLTWSSVQWLVAGLSVGLGFGLQEIVANFICGIILLFEQPIRVGDVVTIDGVTGMVTRIRIRATTVTNWDRQEYIIPNKDLITGRVTNWTLSDSTNRLELRVGVAYGTDTRRACDIIRQICDAHPDVLRDPAPIIVFQEFAASSLTIVVRLYLGTLDRRLPVLNDVHTAIHEQFAAAGITIAFPQLDVHVRQPPA